VERAVVRDLGSRIRFVRKKKALTLKGLSEKTGLSVGFLSEIERGLAEPSMASLRKIREALEVSLITFQEPGGRSAETEDLFPLPPPPADAGGPYIRDARVVRAGERKKLAYPKQPGFYELLTPDLNRRLEVLFFATEPGFDTGPEPIQDPPGEKCMIILKGRMVFRVGEETFHLNPGDSLYYPANSPVSWVVDGSERLEGILIVTPPGF
jgi:transcriptional regulator with XRE-family HTH domain